MRNAEKKYISGNATQGEVLRSQVEASKTSNELLTLEQEKETVEAQLNSILGNSPDEKITSTEELKYEYINKKWDELNKIIISNNPGINKEKINVSIETHSRHYSETGFLPDFDLTYRKRQDKGDWSGQDLMVGFTLPLWFWKPLNNVKE